MPALAILLAVFLSALTAGAQSLTGRWLGSIEIPGTPLAVQVDLVEADGALRGTIDIPQQSADDLPLGELSREGAVVVFKIADVPGTPTFRGELRDDGTTLAGTFAQGGQKFPFTLVRDVAKAASDRAVFDGMQAWLDETRAMFEVPGVAVAVVQGGDVLATFVSGQRDPAKTLPVTPDTLFAIGSSTKAFTTAVLAMLVEEGKLAWDAPVRRWLPEFALADAPLGERITPRDLVTHRSGMPRHDLVWYGASFDRRELVGRLRHLPLNHDLRTDFQYNNLMFLTAGHLAERITGSTWEELVRQRICAPLGMQRTGFEVARMQQDADHAIPYGRRKDAMVPIPFRDITAIGPAGSINSSVREMAAWVALHLQGGKFGERRLLAPDLAADLHVVRMPTGGPAGDGSHIVEVGYALGWFVDVYRGHRRVHHGGNIDGFSALVVLHPTAQIGFVILTNADGSPLPDLVAAALADRALQLPPIDQRAVVLGKIKAARAAGEQAKGKARETRRQGTQPSRPLAQYAGDYHDLGYGPCQIVHEGASLRFRLHGLECALEHWHDDVFAGIAGSGEEAFDGTKVQFVLGFDGEIEALRVRLDSNVAPIVFARKPDARLSDPAFLRTLVGRYESQGQVATIDLQGECLVLTLPGQRHELAPARDLAFRLRGLDGFSMHFELDAAGTVIGASFHQPDGVYQAKRLPAK